MAEFDLFIDTDSVRSGAGEFTDVAAELAALPAMLSDACGAAADSAGYPVLSSALNGFASRFGAELQRQAEVTRPAATGSRPPRARTSSWTAGSPARPRRSWT